MGDTMSVPLDRGSAPAVFINATAHRDKKVGDTAEFAWEYTEGASHPLDKSVIDLSTGHFVVQSLFCDVPLHHTVELKASVSRAASICMEEWETDTPTKIDFTLAWGSKCFTVTPKIIPPEGKAVSAQAITELIASVTFDFRDIPTGDNGQPLDYRDIEPSNLDAPPLPLPKNVLRVKPDEVYSGPQN